VKREKVAELAIIRAMSSLSLLRFLLLAALGGQPLGAQEPPVVVMVSVDGLRHDYLDRGALPTLRRLLREGAWAPLVPVFPSKTFPSHYSIVTGLFPDEHGIISNTIYDPDLDAWFRITDREAVRDGRWWGGEPIWVTAERQGVRTAPLFWPGVEAAIKGVRPTYWLPFDNEMPHERRVAQVLEWLDLPAERRPRFITTYVSVVDVAAHDHGTNSPRLIAALEEADRVLGLLVAGLERRGLLDRVNLLVVSDHGHADRSPDRVIFVDDYLPRDVGRIVDWSPILQVLPAAGMEDSVYRALAGKHPHLAVYRKRDLPTRLRYGTSARVQPIVALADEGWTITTRERYERRPGAYAGADHGWDPALPSMWGTFLARGPAFRASYRGEPFSSIHLYELLARLLGVTPAVNEGSRDSTAQFLRETQSVEDGRRR
jgi:predicted AlkP superfamily pyrophosphatase or phosphodiesterase